MPAPQADPLRDGHSWPCGCPRLSGGRSPRVARSFRDVRECRSCAPNIAPARPATSPYRRVWSGSLAAGRSGCLAVLPVQRGCLPISRTRRLTRNSEVCHQSAIGVSRKVSTGRVPHDDRWLPCPQPGIRQFASQSRRITFSRPRLGSMEIARRCLMARPKVVMVEDLVCQLVYDWRPVGAMESAGRRRAMAKGRPDPQSHEATSRLRTPIGTIIGSDGGGPPLGPEPTESPESATNPNRLANSPSPGAQVGDRWGASGGPRYSTMSAAVRSASATTRLCGPSIT